MPICEYFTRYLASRRFSKKATKAILSLLSWQRSWILQLYLTRHETFSAIIIPISCWSRRMPHYLCIRINLTAKWIVCAQRSQQIRKKLHTETISHIANIIFYLRLRLTLIAFVQIIKRRATCKCMRESSTHTTQYCLYDIVFLHKMLSNLVLCHHENAQPSHMHRQITRRVFFRV